MKKITVSEITKNNRFVTWEKQGQGKLHVPTRAEAEKMHLRTLGLFVAVSSLKFRSSEKAVENAEKWMNKGKSAILDTFFPLPHKNTLNTMF